MKVTKVTQIRPTPFKNGVPRKSQWHWFQNRHLDISIGVTKGLQDSRALRKTTNSYTTFYNNLQTLFSQNNYKPNHIWNSNETCIQVVQQVGVKVIAKRGSHIIYNTIFKYQEWLIIHYVVNVTRSTLPWFYIFKREKMKDNYIKYCKARSCMVMQRNAWMTSFLFKDFLSFIKKKYSRWHFIMQLSFIDYGWAQITRNTKSHKTCIGFKLEMVTLPNHTSHVL